MTVKDFIDKVSAMAEFQIMGWGEDKPDHPYVAIKHLPTALGTTVPLSALEKIDWETLEAVLSGKREPAVLQHISRVVGYFSRIENWNESKLGELHDRHKGNYGLKEISEP